MEGMHLKLHSYSLEQVLTVYCISNYFTAAHKSMFYVVYECNLGRSPVASWDCKVSIVYTSEFHRKKLILVLFVYTL